MRRTGDFNSAKIRLTPALFSRRSRSSSMSAAVVSMSVIGSAATRIHVGAGSVPAGRNTASRKVVALAKISAVEPEHHQTGQVFGVPVHRRVAVTGGAGHPAEDRLVGPPRPG